METNKPRGAIAEALGGTATQRGVKLGIVAACIAIFLLFGASALEHGSNTVNLASGQVGSLVLLVVPGLLAVVIAAILAYYAGLSTPEAQSGAGSRDGLTAGCITMLFFWVGQTLYFMIVGLGSPQGLSLGNFFGQRLLAALLFFVVGGMLGWGGSSAAARRARSILTLPGSSLLSTPGAGVGKPGSLTQMAQPETNIPASGKEQGEVGDAMAAQEATVDAPEQEQD